MPQGRGVGWSEAAVPRSRRARDGISGGFGFHRLSPVPLVSGGPPEQLSRWARPMEPSRSPTFTPPPCCEEPGPLFPILRHFFGASLSGTGYRTEVPGP